MTRRGLLALGLALAALVAGKAAPAQAGQIVYPSGNGIWVMNEDGSGVPIRPGNTAGDGPGRANRGPWPAPPHREHPRRRPAG
jgi:hypothetical protein